MKLEQAKKKKNAIVSHLFPILTMYNYKVYCQSLKHSNASNNLEGIQPKLTFEMKEKNCKRKFLIICPFKGSFT